MEIGTITLCIHACAWLLFSAYIILDLVETIIAKRRLKKLEQGNNKSTYNCDINKNTDKTKGE